MNEVAFIKDDDKSKRTCTYFAPLILVPAYLTLITDPD